MICLYKTAGDRLYSNHIPAFSLRALSFRVQIGRLLLRCLINTAAIFCRELWLVIDRYEVTFTVDIAILEVGCDKIADKKSLG